MLIVPEEIDRLFNVVVATTPFTVLVAMLPEKVKLFDEITVVVAITPFTVEVKTFPVTLCVKELIIFVTNEETPFIIV